LISGRPKCTLAAYDNAFASKQLHLIGGRSHPALTKAVATELHIKPFEMELSNFANGEISCRLGESVRGDDVFVLQPHQSATSTTPS